MRRPLRLFRAFSLLGLLAAMGTITIVTAAAADDLTEAAEAGRKAGEEAIILPGSTIFNADAIGQTVTPYKTDNPPEAKLNGSTISGAADARASGTSVAATTRKAQVDSATSNPRPAMTANDPAIVAADGLNQQADATAGAFFSATGSDGTVCTTEGLGSAGPIERSCERSVSVDNFTCARSLEVEVTRQDTYQCDVTYRADGQVVDQCLAVNAAAQCQQTISACLNLGPDGQCVSERRTYSCLNHEDDASPARLVKTSALDIADHVSETCDPVVETGNCESGTPVCTAGSETRMVNGVPITRECWAWNKPVTCQVAGAESDCTVFENEPNCRRIKSECLAKTDAGQCVHWSDRYRCEGTKSDKTQSCDAMTVCAGGYCETVEPEPADTSFGVTATWLNVLDEMAKDAEKTQSTQEVKVFNGAANTCRVGKLGVLNCCNDTGWGNGILGSCTAEEYDLMDRMQAQATHYIGSYCSKRFFVCLQTKRVYCQFNSKLARVFVEQFREVGGLTWGTTRSSYRYVETCQNGGDRCTYTAVPIEGTGPQCDGISVEQMEAVDMETLDLSEAFAEFVNEAALPSIQYIQDFLVSRVGDQP